MTDQASAALLGLYIDSFLQNPLVRAHEVGAGIDVAASQRLAQEDRMRQRRILLLKRHWPLLDQNQAKQADLLIRHHRTTFLRPVRLTAVCTQQVRSLLLNPQWFDACIHHAPHASAYIEDLRREDPGWWRLGQRRAGKYMELALSRAEVDAFLILASDLGRQAGEQTAVHRFVQAISLTPHCRLAPSLLRGEGWGEGRVLAGNSLAPSPARRGRSRARGCPPHSNTLRGGNGGRRRDDIVPPAQLLHHQQQLPMQLAPFAHAHEAEKMP